MHGDDIVQRVNAAPYVAVNYGGNADTIARNKGIPIADANRIYNDYMSGFKGLKAYQDFRRKDWFAKGYILLSEVTGHKAYIFDYELLRKLNNLFTPEFYSAASKYKGLQDKLGKDTQRTIAEELVDLSFNDVENRWGTANAYRQPISFFWRRKADSEKQSINYPMEYQLVSDSNSLNSVNPVMGIPSQA